MCDTEARRQQRATRKMKAAGYQQRPFVLSCRHLFAIEQQVLQRVARLILHQDVIRWDTIGAQHGCPGGSLRLHTSRCPAAENNDVARWHP